ncbi:hypothetical protein N7495_009741 [Penicillium taxi]|uniref:uncharacterized protein n=1 Tax=Penicillium taxi TaxID=168475 RepID=UPI0025456879|nr:uncharacterized protein N7495_009741 [Penicillium taxi]KAJ5885231.1 hypothetical protein N7495_009741 [Penicillium taxi]
MAICTFFQQGRCRFGERCKFEHPRQTSATSRPSDNRFATFGSGNQLGAGPNKGLNQPAPGLKITTDDIKNDLTVGVGRPDWVFSAYAPAKNAPRQLFGGPQREQSMEEMRLLHYQAVAAGNSQAAIQQAQTLWQESTQQMDAALKDLNGAVRYVIDGEKEHPNRIDMTEGSSGSQTQNVFAQTATPAASNGAFGSPTPGWGQATQPAQTQPAPFGQSTQPTPFGQSVQPTPFGQPSTLGQAVGFGQPSTLGSNSTFGGAQGSSSGFSQSGFARAINNPSPFGQGGMQTQTQTQTPFGQVNQNPNNASPFGQPAAQPNPSPFGQPSQNANPFGQTQPQPAQSNFFSQPAPVSSGFGTVQSATPFGQPAAPQGVPTPPNNAGPQAWVTASNPNELAPIPKLEGETRRDPHTNRLVQWKGRPVQYLHEHPCYLHPQDNQTWVRIIFPEGPPDPASLRDSQGKAEEYTPEIEAMYKFFHENGYWQDGIIPSVPPKAEWISYNF